MFQKFDEGLKRFGNSLDLLLFSIWRANSDPPTSIRWSKPSLVTCSLRRFNAKLILLCSAKTDSDDYVENATFVY